MKNQITTIVNTVKGSKEHIASYGEAVVDLFIDSEVLINVPIVEHAVKVLNIRDVYKTNKIKRNYFAFIESASKLNTVEMERFSSTLFEDLQLGADASETLFEIIAEGEKPIRASIAGNLVLALSKGHIDLASYTNLLLIVHSGSIPALRSIPKTVESMTSFGAWDQHFGIPEEPLLISLGIAQKRGTSLILSSLGKQLYENGYHIANSD